MDRQAKFPTSAAGRLFNVLGVFSTFLAAHRTAAKQTDTYVPHQCSLSTIISQCEPRLSTVICTQGRSQQGATGTNAPARLTGAPRGPLTSHCGVAVANFLLPRRPTAPNCALSKCQGLLSSALNILWSDLRSQIKSQRG